MIRDKIAALKKKGLWMGGPVPLGYQVIERKLVPVPEDIELPLRWEEHEELLGLKRRGAALTSTSRA